MNWLGKPLINLEVMLGYIRGTTTQSGLTVQAFMMDEEFTGGQRVSTTEMDTVAIHSHDTCPNWNYTIQPRSTPGSQSMNVFMILSGRGLRLTGVCRPMHENAHGC